MGGAAYTFIGEYSEINVEKTGFFSRFISNKNKLKNVENLISKELKERFIDYIEIKIEKKNSSNYIKEYLRMDGIFDCSIREYNGKTELQIYFSGCAGMAQISSELSAHWVSHWYKEQRDSIEESLRKYGFNVLNEDKFTEDSIFVPAETAGYAKFILGKESEKDVIPGYVSDLFEVDEAYMENSGEEEFVNLMKELNIKNSEVIKNRKCLCDICKEDENKYDQVIV